jgi:hypothetical protein
MQMKNKSGDGAHMQDYMKTVSNLTNTQKVLVSQMGLQPYISALRSFSFDPRFTAWVFTRFHHMNQFHVESATPYTIGPDDVSKIFGFSNNGKSVINGVRDKSFETKQSIRARLMTDSSDDSWESAAMKVVTEASDLTSEDARGRFITAFAVCTLLILVGDDDTSSDHPPPHFIPALKTPTDFINFNWAAFIFQEISIEVLKAHCAKRSGTEFSPSFAATLFAYVSSHDPPPPRDSI